MTRTTSRLASIEFPTLAVAVAVYGGWLALMTLAGQIPVAWPVLLAAAVPVAWHASLQHEIIHGHPTGNRLLDAMIAWPPLMIWLPFSAYRESHLAHHCCGELTNPACDPESFFVLPADWVAMSAPERLLRRLAGSFAGRVLLGPVMMIGFWWGGELKRMVRGDLAGLPCLALHLLSAGAVLWLAGRLSGAGPLAYALCVVWPAQALILVRSFAEHRPADAQAERTAIVESGLFWRLLFLNNNYHSVHHAEPGLSWYRIPARWRERRAEILADNGGYLIDGYGRLAVRYFLRPRLSPVHPEN